MRERRRLTLWWLQGKDTNCTLLSPSWHFLLMAFVHGMMKNHSETALYGNLILKKGVIGTKD